MQTDSPMYIYKSQLPVSQQLKKVRSLIATFHTICLTTAGAEMGQRFEFRPMGKVGEGEVPIARLDWLEITKRPVQRLQILTGEPPKYKTQVWHNPNNRSCP